MDSLKIENLSPVLNPRIEERFSARDEGAQVEREALKQGLDLGESPKEGGSFSDVLEQSLDQVNQLQLNADSAMKEFVAGRTKNIHETMLAIEQADVSLKMMMQVRNKIIEAYREIMKMQV